MGDRDAQPVRVYRVTDWPDTLDALDERIWQMLTRAVADRKSPWRLAQLGTVDDAGCPQIRTLVLRAVGLTARTLDLHTDARSGKVDEIAALPEVALLFWDPRGQTQLRLSAVATILGPDRDETRDIFNELPPGSIQPYRQAAPPGRPLENPADAIDAAPPRDPVEALADFRVLRLTVRDIDFLWLRSGGHRRAKFTYRAGDPTAVSAHWVGP